MVQKSTAMMPSGNPKPRPTRTSNSIVWRYASGRDFTARDLVSSVRFVWDSNQTQIFRDFLMKVGPGFKNADITPLLIDLNLDGFERILNDHGENVHTMIVEKVCRKLKATADRIDHKVLLEASRRYNGTKPAIIEDDDDIIPAKEEEVSTEDFKSSKSAPVVKKEVPPKAPHRSSNPSYEKVSAPSSIPKQKAKPTEQTHPFLKIPKPKVAPAPPAPRSNVKREPESPPPFIFSASPAVSSPATPLTPPTPTPAAKVKSEQPRPLLDLLGLQNHRPPPVPPKLPKNPKATELHQATKRLNAILSAAEEATKSVKFALRDIGQSEAKEEMVTLLLDMTKAFCDVQVAADDLEDMARENEAKD